MSAMFRVLVFASLAALTAACSSEAPPGNKTPEAAEKKEPAGESPQDARLGSLEAKYKKIESFAQANPREKDYILGQIDELQKDAAGTEYAEKAGKLAGEVRSRFDEDARKTYEKLDAGAKKLVADKQYRAALDLLGEYPEEFAATEWKAKLDKMLEPLEAEVDAENRLQDTLRAVDDLKEKSPEAALRRLSEFPEYMRLGKRKEEWEKVHAELSARVKELEEQRHQEEALPWEDLYTGGDMDRWTKGAGEWEVRDGCIVGKYKGNPESAGQICYGSESSDWDNLIVEVEFKVVSGDYFILGTRGKNVEGQGSTFAQIDLGPRYLPADQFHEVAVEIRAETYSIRDKIGRIIHTDKMDEGYTKGFICFYVSDGGEVHIRKVRLKHLK